MIVDGMNQDRHRHGLTCQTFDDHLESGVTFYNQKMPNHVVKTMQVWCTPLRPKEQLA